MIGLGTNTQSHYGWSCDADDGRPELWYWQGTVMKNTMNWDNTSWPGHWFSCCDGSYCPDFNHTWHGCWTPQEWEDSCDECCWNCHGSNNPYWCYWPTLYGFCQYGWDGYWDNPCSWEFVPSKSNKLFKLTYDLDSKTVGRTLVWDANASGAYPTDQSRLYGNLTFISKDVFLLAESDSSEPGYATWRRVVIWANKITDDGDGTYTVTPKIWSRVLLKDCDAEATNCTDNNSGSGGGDYDYRNSYPGQIAGLSFVPPESDAYDNLWDITQGNSTPAKAQILALTRCYSYGGPWGGEGDSGQQHKVQILRLETDNADIGNNYLEKSDSWNAQPDSVQNPCATCIDSSWRLVKSFGGNTTTTYDFNEGWMTTDSKGNMYAGMLIDPTPGGWPGAGLLGTGTINTPVVTFPNNVVGNASCDTNCSHEAGETMYLHDTVIFENPITTSNKTICNFHTIGAIDAGDDGLSHSSVVFGQCADCTSHWDNPRQNPTRHYNDRNVLYAEGGCCDIYGQGDFGKDAVFAFVPRHNRFLREGFMEYTFNDQQVRGLWDPMMSYNREGLYVFKRNETTPRILDFEYFAGTDTNGNETCCLTLDSTWSSGTGSIPKLPTNVASGAEYPINDSVYYDVRESGLSFRPNWKL